MLAVPKGIGNNPFCYIYVTPLQPDTHVAVGTAITGLDPLLEPKALTGTSHNNGIRMFDCKDHMSTYQNIHTIYVFSDKDVGVSVIVKHAMVTFNLPIKHVTINPVDMFGFEIMILGRKMNTGAIGNHRYCIPLSPFLDSEMTWTTPSAKDAIFNVVNEAGVDVTGTFVSGSTLKIKNKIVRDTQILGDRTGTHVTFTRPSTLFCGEMFTGDAFDYEQYPPIDTWSSSYIIPSFGEPASNRPFEAKLKFVASRDNTIINITGGFDAMHVLYDRGDSIEQEIDILSYYHITSNEVIGVAIEFYNPQNTNYFTFHQVLAPHNFLSGCLSVAPSKVVGMTSNGDIYSFFSKAGIHNITQLDTSLKRKNDFYFDWLNEGPCYGFTVVLTDVNKWFIVPQFGVSGRRVEWVKHIHNVDKNVKVMMVLHSFQEKMDTCCCNTSLIVNCTIYPLKRSLHL